MPQPTPHSTRDYDRIARAIAYLRDHAAAQPTLGNVAHHVAMSEYHLQRLFARWAGISPKRFLQYLTLRNTIGELRSGAPVLQVADRAGLSGGGRLHDLCVNLVAMTPGEYRSGAAGMVIRWGVHATPFGTCLVGLTARGVCALHFPDGNVSPEAWLEAEWPGARLQHAPHATAPIARRAFEPVANTDAPLHLLVRGTNLQIQVWQALLSIAPGTTATYAGLAASIGRPAAVRAIANAVAANRIACLIPCHRVLRSDGGLGGYRWNVERKTALLAREHMQAETM